MGPETSECENYKKFLEEYLIDQQTRQARRIGSWLFNIESNNNNREAEKLSKIELAFQSCELSRLNKIEEQLERMSQEHQKTQGR